METLENQQQFSNIPYDVIELPSKGVFYKNGVKEAKVTYLTAADENILTSQNLIQKGNLVDTLLRRKTLGNEINITELLECDKQAILIFLRNTAYGPTYDVQLIDPKTKEEFTTTIDLSNIKTKEFNLVADKNGEFDFKLPQTGKPVKFKFLTSTEQEELNNLDEYYKSVEVVPSVTRRLELHIQEIEGVRDGGQLAQMIQSMPIKDSQALRRYINDQTPGLDLERTVIAPSGAEVTTRIAFGAAFFRTFFGV